MAVLNIINIFPQSLAIINNTAKTLAVVSNNKSASSNLNYIIGGLAIVILVLVGSVLFNKK